MQGKLISIIALSVILNVFPEPIMAQENLPKVTVDWYGYIGGDFRYFTESPLYEGQFNSYFSSVFKPQLFIESKNRKHQLHFMGFVRINQHDKNQTRADLRDFYGKLNLKRIELNAGIKTVSWGKTESNHLVDIINQYDLLEGRSLEHKLGQPMVQLVHTSKWFNLDFITTTYHRELKFPGPRGRLQPGFIFEEAVYEKTNGKYIPDFGLRITKSSGNFDFGISNFYGTNRLPNFEFENEKVTLIYQEINQLGMEFQWITGPIIWKGEYIHLTHKQNTINAFTIGGEYNLLFNSGPELKWIAEYTYDERGQKQINGINNDLFYGINLSLNDRQTSILFLGGYYDFDFGSVLMQAKAERRFAKNWKIALSYSGISNTEPEDFYHLIRKDSFLEVSILNFFSE